MATCLRWLDVGIRAVKKFFHHETRTCGEVRSDVELVGATVDGAADFKTGSVGEDHGEQHPPTGVVQGAFALRLRVGAFPAKALHLAVGTPWRPRAVKSVKNPLAGFPTYA